MLGLSLLLLILAFWRHFVISRPWRSNSNAPASKSLDPPADSFLPAVVATFAAVAVAASPALQTLSDCIWHRSDGVAAPAAPDVVHGHPLAGRQQAVRGPTSAAGTGGGSRACAAGSTRIHGRELVVEFFVEAEQAPFVVRGAEVASSPSAGVEGFVLCERVGGRYCVGL